MLKNIHENILKNKSPNLGKLGLLNLFPKISLKHIIIGFLVLYMTLCDIGVVFVATTRTKINEGIFTITAWIHGREGMLCYTIFSLSHSPTQFYLIIW